MNQRLITIYDEFTSKHREKFLANDIEKHQTPIAMEVKKNILRKENQYPSLHTTDLAHIRLQ